ncbi:Glycerophosphodiester phosphodiesterase domain-containing protein 5 [Varanus komodoensis]|nr:Glycerophosphodiester phosphodiesterase domain-containing protein 5 [Varanus komodoensis]
MGASFNPQHMLVHAGYHGLITCLAVAGNVVQTRASWLGKTSHRGLFKPWWLAVIVQTGSLKRGDLRPCPSVSLRTYADIPPVPSKRWSTRECSPEQNQGCPPLTWAERFWLCLPQEGQQRNRSWMAALSRPWHVELPFGPLAEQTAAVPGFPPGAPFLSSIQSCLQPLAKLSCADHSPLLSKVPRLQNHGKDWLHLAQDLYKLCVQVPFSWRSRSGTGCCKGFPEDRPALATGHGVNSHPTPGCQVGTAGKSSGFLPMPGDHGDTGLATAGKGKRRIRWSLGPAQQVAPRPTAKPCEDRAPIQLASATLRGASSIILALCHIAVGQQMNLHWIHKMAC